MSRKQIFAYCLLTAALFSFALPAFADRDAVQFGSNIRVSKGSSVHDAVCFFCSVDAEGEIQGNVVVFFGDVRLSGKADHDVVNFFGKVRADDNASIGGDLVSMFGVLRLGENVSVGKDMVAMFGGVHAASTVTVAGNRVAQPFWLFLGPLLLVGAVIFLIVREVRARRPARFAAYPYPPPPPPQR